MLAWAACCIWPQSPPARLLLSLLGGLRPALIVLGGTGAVHLLEGLFALYVALAELRLPLAGALRWAAVVSIFGYSCLRWLLLLRGRAKTE